MFHTGGDCVACQPLLFPTVNICLLHSEIYFTFGWIIVYKRKVFVRCMGNWRVLQCVFLIQQYKFFLIDYFFLQAQ